MKRGIDLCLGSPKTVKVGISRCGANDTHGGIQMIERIVDVYNGLDAKLQHA